MNLYDELELSKDCTSEEIKQKYRLLAQIYHPDKAVFGDEEKFKRIKLAYETLSDPVKRAEYDSTGFGTTFTFNRNNPVVTFFDPRVRISQATTAAIEPTNDSTTGNITNAITFTTPPNDVFEVYAKTSTSGNATSTNAYTFVSSSGVASNTITLAQTHNLSLGSPITYYGENNVVSGLINGGTF